MMRKAAALLWALAFAIAASATFAVDDPDKSFQAFVSEAARASDGVSWTTGTKNVTRVAHVSDVRYEVKKTASPDTPVVGEVSFVMRTRITDAVIRIDDTRLRYAWRDGRWVVMDGVATRWAEISGFAGSKQTDPITREQLASPTPAQAPWYQPRF